MIISKTPFRISFFGGGTDYPAWLKENEGAVLSTTIDKYCYVSCRYLPPFFEHKIRVSYTLTEMVQNTDEIKHPSVRHCLKYMGIEKGVEIHHDGDLPSRTGLGSSSSFTVGLLNCLYALKGRIIFNMDLAKEAIHVEQNLIKEAVGCQDQISAACGGLNLIRIKNPGEFTVSPLTINGTRLKDFHSHLMLIYTGLSRIASEIAERLVKTASQKREELKSLYGMVNDGVRILNGNGDLADFGKLLHESWLLKRCLTDKITTPIVDQIYEMAMKTGALGGKLLGAGGGGFLLLFARPEDQGKIKANLEKFLHVPFHFDNSGSQIIFYKPEEPL